MPSDDTGRERKAWSRLHNERSIAFAEIKLQNRFGAISHHEIGNAIAV